MHLFQVPIDKIEVLIHPQSIIHSGVQFVDGSVKVQMGMPDMRLPIQFAIGYPDRIKSDFPRVDFFSLPKGLTFEKPDLTTFRNLAIAMDSARRGGGAYMQGSDNVTFSNCYFENSTSGTNGGGLDWLAGANYGKVINCTFNNTRAARSAGAIYYDGDYGEMANITIINATAFGGALKESEDHKVQYAGWDASHWDTNTTGGDAGAIMFTGDHIYVYNATFINCTAAGRGGAVFLQDNENVTFELCNFEKHKTFLTHGKTLGKKETMQILIPKWTTLSQDTVEPSHLMWVQATDMS